MDSLMNILNLINGVLWGPLLLVLLLGTGLFLSVGLRFRTQMLIGTSFRLLWKGRKHGGDDKGEISPFNALMTALSATIGTGNIAGVATAVAVGGPGALFWMWMTAIVGIGTKFAETVLAQEFRERSPRGHWVGGPMYYIKNGLGKRWLWLATLFACFGALCGFGIGNLTQTHAIAAALGHYGVPTWLSAIVLLLVVGAIILGGVKRIGSVSGKLVPFMAFVYVSASLVIIVLNIDKLPAVLSDIFTHAFTPSAATGGFAGATIMLAIQTGVARGIFSNEAGMGSAPIAHATASTRDPVSMGLIGMLGTFLDTIIVCSMTGFAVLLSGLWTDPDTTLRGTLLTMAAYEQALPGFGNFIVTASQVLFALTTVLGWCVYSERCVIYLFGDLWLTPFRVLFVAIVPLGALTSLTLVWTVADILNALMAFPNLIALLLLSPVVFRLFREYELRSKAQPNGENLP